MIYTHQGFTSEEADNDLWIQMQNKLNSLTSTQARSAKLAASDMKGKDARGVVFFSDGEDTGSEELGSAWVSQQFATANSYEDMYEDCQSFLTELTDAQSYYARIVMTNASNNHSHIEVFYRNLKNK